MIWCCPRCRGKLVQPADDHLRCTSCESRYEVVAGIPDLRVPGAVWIDCDQDREKARTLARETVNLPLEHLVRRVYAERPGWVPWRVELRTKQVVTGAGRMAGELTAWLDEPTREPGFLDLGCGGGMLLSAAAAAGRSGIGIDVSMIWLVVAQRMIAEHGGTPVLAAALAEALPLPDGAVSAVVSLDVIEHVADPVPYLREIDRVTVPGGAIALSTPNRYSLTAEPHIFVWGVGWVPRRWQKRYVKLVSGKSYDYNRLLSTHEARRLVRGHTRFSPAFLIPNVPTQEIERFPPWRAALARLYNRLSQVRWLRFAWLAVGPFFRIVGRKGPTAP